MRSFIAGLLCVLCLSACKEESSNRKATYPLTGQVYVDGVAPDSAIAVKCLHVKGIVKSNPTVSSAFTEEDGKFAISTYEKGDGIPPGDYILTFYWGKRNVISTSYGGPDKLKGRYKDPKKSEFKVTVVEGEPTDLGRIDLKTK